jgi:hypothetical protein
LDNGVSNPDDSRIRICYGSGVKAFGLLCTAFFIAILILAPISVEQGWATNYDKSSFVILLMFVLLSLGLCSEVFLTWYEVNEEGIKYHGIWRRHFIIRWEDIKSIDKLDNSRIRIVGQHNKLTLAKGLEGFFEFIALVRNRLPEEKWTGLNK